MGDSLTAEVFETWEQWPAAYGRVGRALGWDVARDEFRRRLPLGSLRACAREAFWEYEDKPGAQKREFEILSSKLWEGRTPTNYSNVWQSGSLDFNIESYGVSYETQVQGLRLEPSGVDQILIDAGHVQGINAADAQTEIAKTSRKQDLPNLPEPIAKAWAAWYLSNPNPTQDGAQKSASHMFPNHNFSRQRVRDLIGQMPQGRPKKPVD